MFRWLLYRSEVLLRLAFVGPFRLLFLTTRKTRASARFGSILIYDISRHPRQTDFLFEIAQTSLRLLSAIDPRRFQRVQREISAILFDSRALGVLYQPLGRWCLINRHELNLTRIEFAICEVAGLLIYGATLGLLSSRKFPFTRTSMDRYGKLCEVEVSRFTKRLNPQMVRDFVSAEGWTIIRPHTP
jgi:hypothetical protein